MKKLVGLVLVLSFEAGSALIVTYILRSFYDLPFWIYFLNGFIAISPDLDVLRSFVRKEADSYHKLFFTHFPIVMIELGIIMGLIFNVWFGYPWFATALLLLLHYFHDTIEPLGIVAWLAPFKMDTYHLFLTKNFPFVELRKHEIIDLSFWDWVEKYYTKVNTETVAGFILLVIGLALFTKDFLGI